MPTDRDILTLAQWLSPAYPVGAFAYAHGLESTICDGRISAFTDLQDWLEDIIMHGSGRNDCILLRAAYDSENPTELDHVNDTALAFASSSERQTEQKQQGAAFVRATAAIWGGEDTHYVYPVAVGAAAARLEIDVTLTSAMYLQAVIGNLISAAQRLMALGQTEGQAILAALTRLCETTAKATEGLTLDDLESSAFMVDITAMHHETLQPRIFRT